MSLIYRETRKVLMAGLGLADLICQTTCDAITTLSERGEKAAKKLKCRCEASDRAKDKHTQSSCRERNIDEAIEALQAATDS